jgi:hypothetical protein
MSEMHSWSTASAAVFHTKISSASADSKRQGPPFEDDTALSPNPKISVSGSLNGKIKM